MAKSNCNRTWRLTTFLNPSKESPWIEWANNDRLIFTRAITTQSFIPKARILQESRTHDLKLKTTQRLYLRSQVIHKHVRTYVNIRYRLQPKPSLLHYMQLWILIPLQSQSMSIRYAYKECSSIRAWGVTDLVGLKLSRVAALREDIECE